MLLAEDQIQSWINTRTQKKKKREKEQGERTEKEAMEGRLIQEQMTSDQHQLLAAACYFVLF